MTDAMIQCPKCKTAIPLTEAMAGPLLAAERDKFANEIKRVSADVDVERRQLAAQRENFNAEVAQAARKQTSEEVERVRKEASKAADMKVDAMRAQAEAARADVATMNAKLVDAQKAQADAVRKSRELDDARRELELTVEKRVSEQSNILRSSISADLAEENRLRVAEKEHTIEQMTKQIDDLKRRAEQGSQQLQGEVQELELERELATAFPIDVVEPIGKGIHGADCRQVVMSTSGVRVGSILWESKRTKNWGNDWTAKLRDDQRNGQDSVAVICSRVLPEGVKTFGVFDSTWVTAPQYAMPLACALRIAMLDVAAVKISQQGQATKAELLYQYLTGAQFRHRIEAVVERFTEMREDLDRERKFLTKQLSKREEQLGQVVASMSGLYGDLQGIAGKAIAELPGAQFMLEE